MDYNQYTLCSRRPVSTCCGDGSYQNIMATHPNDSLFEHLDPALHESASSQYPQLDLDMFGDDAAYLVRSAQDTHLGQFGYMERGPPYPRPFDSPQSQSQSTSSDVHSPRMDQDFFAMQYEYGDLHIHRSADSGDHQFMAMPSVSMPMVSPELGQVGLETHNVEPFDLNPNFEMVTPERAESFSSVTSSHDINVPTPHPLLDNHVRPEDRPIQPEISVSAYSMPSPSESHSDPVDDDNNSMPGDDLDSNRTSRPRVSGNRRLSATNKGRKPNNARPSTGRVAKHKKNNSRNHAMTSTAATTPMMQGLSCSSCQREFRDDESLQRHVKTTHARAFTCVFGFAGCTSTFASKNEWKRHVLSQHVLLLYWICTEPSCADTYKDTQGAIFNRKDLYTQHVRRMHIPAHFRKQLKTRKTVPEWDELLRQMQEGALRHRCQLPTLLQCPASGCGMEFNGTNAWDDRMEHVARHLEKAALGEEHEVRFGGKADHTLNDWAASPQVGIIRPIAGDDKWELAQPLKTTSQGNSTARNAREQNSDSEDGHFEFE